MVFELAFQAQIEVLAAWGDEVHVAMTTESGAVVESCDLMRKHKGSILRFSTEVKDLKYSLCGERLAVALYESIHLFQRETPKGKFLPMSQIDVSCDSLLWTKRFHLVAFGANEAVFIDWEEAKVVGKIDLEISTVSEGGDTLILGTKNKEIYFYTAGTQLKKTEFEGEIIYSSDTHLILYWKDQRLDVDLLTHTSISQGFFPLQRLSSPYLGYSSTGITLFHPSESVVFISDSPALALFRKDALTITTPTLSLTTTPHFTPSPFSFEPIRSTSIQIPSQILSEIARFSELPMVERRQKQARIRGDQEEMRFWSLIQEHKPNVQRHNSSLKPTIGNLSMVNLKRGEASPQIRSARLRPHLPLTKSRTPPKQSGKSQTRPKNTFSTPVREVRKPSIFTPKKKGKPTAPQSLRKTTVTPAAKGLRPGCLSEKKTRPGNDVFQLAVDTSALLKSCFDSNRSRKALLSDGESQVTDCYQDCSDAEAQISWKSESPSPSTGRKRADSRTGIETFFLSMKTGGTIEVSTSATACKELLSTSKDSTDFKSNIYKACVLAASVSPAFHQAILYESAQRFKDSQFLEEAVELLSLSNRYSEACSLLETHGKWSESLLLSKRFRTEFDVKETVFRWVSELCSKHLFLEAVKVSLEQEETELISTVLERCGKTELAGTYAQYCVGVKLREIASPVPTE